MNYGASEDLQCDFPPCGGQYDQREGALVAILKNGEVLAFCSDHAALLVSHQIPLRSLREIHAELDRPVAETARVRQQITEAAFIASLK